MNFTENKIFKQNKKLKAFLFVVFFVLGFGFFNNVAHAGWCYCKEGTQFDPSLNPSTHTAPEMDGDKACNAWCRDSAVPKISSDAYYLYYSEQQTKLSEAAFSKCVSDEVFAANENSGYNSKRRQEVLEIAKNLENGNHCGLTDLGCNINFFLFSLLRFFGWILTGAATLFEWIVKPENISGRTGLLNNGAVKDVWIMVRDTLNMTFILVLLFAAFCTVFQVEKWNLQKVWLSILINALLVNFSFPIARFFIDVSNVAMYYFLNNMFSGTGQGSGSSIMASFGQVSQLSGILVPNGYEKAETSYIIAAIIFTFIFAVTLYVLAALFVIRLVALVMVVMFSPIGFVANIFPEMSKFASDWWGNLFKYSFFGPIMVFMMMISLKIMASMPSNFNSAAQKNAPADMSEWIAHTAFFMIPIFILWMSMGIAQKMGVEGADKVVGAGQKFAKWAGNLPVRGVKTATKAAANKFDRDVLKSWSPRAIKSAWDARNKDIEDKHLSVATGAWHDRFNKIYRSGKTNYKELAEHQIIAKRQKELLDGGTDESADQLAQMEKLLGQKSVTAQTDIQAFMRMLIGQNDHDDLMKWIQEHIDANDGAGDEIGKKLIGMGINKNNYDINNGNVAHAIDKILEASGVDEEHRDTHLQDLGSIAVQKGGIMFGTTEVDKKTGKRKKTYTVDTDGFVDASKASQIAARKIMTTPDAQNVPKTMHRNFFTDQGSKGAKLNESGKALMRHYASASAIEQAGRHKSDFYDQVGGDASITTEMLKYAKEMGTKGVMGYVNDKYVPLAADPTKARQAAGWTVAIQRRSGVSEENIDKILEAAGYTETERADVKKAAAGPSKGEEKKPKAESEETDKPKIEIVSANHRI